MDLPRVPVRRLVAGQGPCFVGRFTGPCAENYSQLQGSLQLQIPPQARLKSTLEIETELTENTKHQLLAHVCIMIAPECIGCISQAVALWPAGDGKYCLVAGQDRTVRLYNPHRGDPDKEGTATAGELEEGLLVKSYAGPHG